MSQKTKHKRTFNEHQRQTSVLQKTSYAKKHTHGKQIQHKCHGKSASVQKQTFYDCDRRYSLRRWQQNQINSTSEAMIQIVPCSVVLEKLNLGDISNYYRIPLNIKNNVRKVPQVSQTASSLSSNNGQMFVVKKIEPVSLTPEKQVSTVQRIRSRRKCSFNEFHNSSNDVQVFIQKHEPVEACLTTPERKVSNVQKYMFRRKCSISETKSSSDNLKMSVVEKSEPIEKFSSVSEKQMSSAHKLSRISETYQNSSNSIEMPTIKQLEPAELLPTTLSKQMSTLQRTKSKRQCSTPKKLRTKHSKKHIPEQQTLSKYIAKSSASFQAEFDGISSSRPKRQNLRKSNSYGDIPIDDISFSRSSQSYKEKSDCVLQKPVLRKTRHKKQSSNSIQTKKAIVQEIKKGKKKTPQKQRIYTQSKKRTTKCNKKMSSVSNRLISVGSNLTEENIPIDDISIVVSQSPVRKAIASKSKTLRSYKKNLARKRLAMEEVKKAENAYEDDIYEFKNFDKFKELLVDTSVSPVSSSMPTPELGIRQLNPCIPSIHEKSPKYEDCISQSDFALYRKVAEECIYKKYPEKRGCNADITITW